MASNHMVATVTGNQADRNLSAMETMDEMTPCVFRDFQWGSTPG